MENSIIFSIRISLQVSLLSTILIVISGIPTAYFLARKNFKGREIIDMVCTLPLVLPPTVTGYYLILLFGRNGLIGNIIYQWTGWSIMFTWYAAVLASYFVALPLMIKTSRAAIESVNTRFIESSYALGLSEFQTAVYIIIPLAKKGIWAGAVLSFARSMGEFGATLMLAGSLPGKTDTMPIAIYTLTGSGEWTKAHILVVIMTFISGFVLYIANSYSRKII